MTTPRSIVWPVALSPAELSYLLALLRAEHLLGADARRVLPDAPAERERLWREGRAALETAGWLVRLPAGEQYHLNDQLLAVIAAMADPDIVIASTVARRGEPEGAITHYLSPAQTVEQIFDGERYQIVALAGIETLAARLAQLLGLPQPDQRSQPAGTAPENFILTAEAIGQATADPTPARLLALGAPPWAVEPFVAVLREPRAHGRLHLLRAKLGRVLHRSQMQFLVNGGTMAFVGEPLAGDRVRFTAVAADSFAVTLQERVAELKAAAV